MALAGKGEVHRTLYKYLVRCTLYICTIDLHLETGEREKWLKEHYIPVQGGDRIDPVPTFLEDGYPLPPRTRQGASLSECLGRLR